MEPQGGTEARESDELLVERAKHDPAAFGELYEKYLPHLYNYVYYRAGNTLDAEDLTEKVFLQALIHLPRYRYLGLPFSAWLFRIAHNVLANWHRDQGRRQELWVSKIAGSEGVASEPQVEEWAQVRGAVAKLSPLRQHLVLLKYVEGMSNAEIGQVLGRSEGAVKAMLHRTLKALQAELDTAGEEETDHDKASQKVAGQTAAAPSFPRGRLPRGGGPG